MILTRTRLWTWIWFMKWSTPCIDESRCNLPFTLACMRWCVLMRIGITFPLHKSWDELLLWMILWTIWDIDQAYDYVASMNVWWWKAYTHITWDKIKELFYVFMVLLWHGRVSRYCLSHGIIWHDLWPLLRESSFSTKGTLKSSLILLVEAWLVSCKSYCPIISATIGKGSYVSWSWLLRGIIH